jgi:hypothetical protein
LHILGPAACTVRVVELDHAGDPGVGDGELRWANEHATWEVYEVLRQTPARQVGKSRLDTLLYTLDAGMRSRPFRKTSDQRTLSGL